MHVKNLTVLGNSSGSCTPVNLGLLSCFLFFTRTKLLLPLEFLHKLFPLPVTRGGGCFLCAPIILKNPVVTFLIEGLFSLVLERLALFVSSNVLPSDLLASYHLPLAEIILGFFFF